MAEASDEDLIEVVTTNTLGLMICCREAMKLMLNQPRGGHIFNIDGAGSDGRPTPRFSQLQGRGPLPKRSWIKFETSGLLTSTIVNYPQCNK
ncbi:chlorophyll(ide) b reductase NOL, chloroplastic-like [Spinacia oleracea]|uniref:Chlorophyll(Ide) b reductase NOL, chloroplastic-like n=1 Tax=Spinacia oleracea TaxID=3562 RepID=A0A9R0JIA5_SPIOL|nr:chlorophyll(ide) b reductase NOL, chloroplastic-like [Spinacia oleracea]XP_056691152.1 chlorophyll(ide) b reductase NOL, chloroplastic-like [Spinacia oleracea]